VIVRRGLASRVLIAAAILVPSAVVSLMAENREFHSKVVVTEATLPDKVGTWDSQSVPLTDSERSMLDSPAASQRVYNNAATGDQVQIMVLQVNNTQNAHDPKLCMAGSGFTLDSEKVQMCPWASGSAAYPISWADFEKGDAHITMYYWLQTAGGSIANMSGGLKLEGLRKALMGSTVKGVAVRVIALPNRLQQSAPTDPKVAAALWETIAKRIQFDKLVARL
jgi:EpsI family protein